LDSFPLLRGTVYSKFSSKRHADADQILFNTFLCILSGLAYFVKDILTYFIENVTKMVKTLLNIVRFPVNWTISLDNTCVLCENTRSTLFPPTRIKYFLNLTFLGIWRKVLWEKSDLLKIILIPRWPLNTQ
jgi:hypothetical protein